VLRSFKKETTDLARLLGKFSSTKIPVSPFLTKSLSPGILYATTGVPEEFASITTRAQPSRVAGTRAKCDLLSDAYLSSELTRP
jgi:hypothetical protein